LITQSQHLVERGKKNETLLPNYDNQSLGEIKTKISIFAVEEILGK
jgi:hypothetical protein